MTRAVSRLRIAMYSHDTFGLGHLTRTLRLARAIGEAFPGASILVITGSPWAHRVALPPGVHCLRLPAVRKRGIDDYVSLDPQMPFRRLREKRSTMIHDALLLFQPHMLFVDNVPLGMKGELRPALETLRRRLPETSIHLNLRDVLDEPAVIRAQWEATGVDTILDHMYDQIHVFGQACIYDAVTAYGLPEAKTRFLGYLAPSGEEAACPPASAPGSESARRVLVTTGGGEDGTEIPLSALELAESLGADSPFHFDIVLGPFVPPSTRDLLWRRADARPGGVRLYDWIEHLAGWMPHYDVVVSMGGYNTMCEVMARARRSIVLPRVAPRREQDLRARALESRGLVRVLPLAGLSGEALGQALRSSLDGAELRPSPLTPSLDGLRAFRDRLGETARPPHFASRIGATVPSERSSLGRTGR